MVVNFEPLISHLPVWLLVLFRLSGIFLFAPVFGSLFIPARVKVFLALGLSFCVYPMLLTPGTAAAANLVPAIELGLSFWSLVGVVGAELGIGLVIGYGATLPLLGMQWGGRAIAQQMGLGLAEVLSPDQEQSGILGQLFYLLALVVFLNLNGHHVLLRILVDSFSTIPLGGFRIDGHVIDLIVGLMTTMLHLAIRVAAPLVCLIFLETLATGFIARTVPQMNILSIGFSVRILLGVTLLIAAISVQSDVAAQFMYQMFLAPLKAFFEMPAGLPI